MKKLPDDDISEDDGCDCDGDGDGDQDGDDVDDDDDDSNFGLRRSPPSVRSATMATNRMVGTSTFGFIKIIPPKVQR